MNAARDWTIRRHRAVPRGLGVSHAAAGGLAVVGVLAASVSVAGVLGVHPITTSAQPGGVWQEPSLVTGQPGPSPSASKAPPANAPPTGSPTRIRIPKISVDTSLESLGLDKSGALQAPSYTDAGWYAGGTAPGDIGPAVIAGHIDSTRGPAVFFYLSRLNPGDLIQVERGGKWISFTVVATGRYPKTDFPTADVYGPTPTPQLRLITCGGTFDKNSGSYLDNVVVYAVIKS